MMNEIKKQEKIIGEHRCFIYDCGSVDTLIIQPVDDHDIDVLDNEVSEIVERAGGKGFSLIAFKVCDWNDDLSPWEAVAVFGDKEEKTRNPVMRTVGDNLRRQHELLTDGQHIKCILEMNQGNHFKEPEVRTAKGFA